MILASDMGHRQRHLVKLAKSFVLIALLLFVVGCSESSQTDDSLPTVSEPSAIFAPRPKLKQVDPPPLIQELAPWLDAYAPQVKIYQPKTDQILDTTTVNVDLRVQDLPIYKDKTWEMGPHLELLLDNQPYETIYDIEKPIVLRDLSPGTHTLRALAERPWHESFKNEGSYAQVTFHVFAKTGENSPAANQPVLTYGSPIGSYGAEPVLLDFYLTDAPLHQVAQGNPAIADWSVRYTLNGDSLTLEDWRSIYIEGLKPGKNWVQLTLVDDEGNPMEGVFNNTVRLIDYNPDLDDTLAKIIQGDLTLEEVGSIIDPSYEPPIVEPPTPEPVERPLTEEITEDTEPDNTLGTDSEASDISEPEISEPEVEEPGNKLDISEPDVIGAEVAKPAVTEPASADAIQNSLKTTTPDQPSDSAAEDKAIETNVLDTSGILENKSIDDNSIETQPDDTDQALEKLESETNQTEFLDTYTDNASESNSENTADEALSTDVEATTDLPEESKSNSSNLEEITPPKRRYLQRLYDYRERSMETYGRER